MRERKSSFKRYIYIQDDGCFQHIEYITPPGGSSSQDPHNTAAPPDTLQVPRAARPTHWAQVKAILCVGMNIGPLLAPGRGSGWGGCWRCSVSLLLTLNFSLACGWCWIPTTSSGNKRNKGAVKLEPLAHGPVPRADSSLLSVSAARACGHITASTHRWCMFLPLSTQTHARKNARVGPSTETYACARVCVGAHASSLRGSSNVHIQVMDVNHLSAS